MWQGQAGSHIDINPCNATTDLPDSSFEDWASRCIGDSFHTVEVHSVEELLDAIMDDNIRVCIDLVYSLQYTYSTGIATITSDKSRRIFGHSYHVVTMPIRNEGELELFCVIMSETETHPADEFTGAVYNTGQLVVIGSTFSCNRVFADLYDFNSVGSAITNRGGSVVAVNTMFYSNVAGDYGGAVATIGGSFVCKDCVFQFNLAYTAGAVWVADNSSGVCLLNSAMYDNEAVGDPLDGEPDVLGTFAHDPGDAACSAAEEVLSLYPTSDSHYTPLPAVGSQHRERQRRLQFPQGC